MRTCYVLVYPHLMTKQAVVTSLCRERGQLGQSYLTYHITQRQTVYLLWVFAKQTLCLFRNLYFGSDIVSIWKENVNKHKYFFKWFYVKNAGGDGKGGGKD